MFECPEAAESAQTATDGDGKSHNNIILQVNELLSLPHPPLYLSEKKH